MSPRLNTIPSGARGGEENPLSLSSLYRDYHKLVRSVLFRICGSRDLDDLVQETFVRVWQGLDKFKEESSPKTWIYRIAVNTAIDHQRKNRNRKFDVELSPSLEGSDRARGQICWNLFQRGLATLSIDHRTVLVLESMEGFSIDEIATVVGAWKGTVKSRLFYAKKQMLRFLDENGVNI
jgi:RNA polymerase sigma-70 factor (ECF subfamily)